MAKHVILITKNGEALNCTVLNNTTQRAMHVIGCYEYSSKDSIYKAYGRPSNAKVEAWNKIAKECSDVGGRMLYVTGAGSDVFSCAYQVESQGGKNYLIYHTPLNRFAIAY